MIGNHQINSVRGGLMRSVFINMEGIDIHGNILDVSIRGNNVIPQIIDDIEYKDISKKYERDYEKWNFKDELNIEKKSYDYIVCFFSMDMIMGEKRYDKFIKNVKKIIKEGGTIIIWDIYTHSVFSTGKYEIRAKISDEKFINMPYTLIFNPFRVKYNKIVDILKNNGFKIVKSSLKNDYYYIEANKEKEDNK